MSYKTKNPKKWTKQDKLDWQVSVGKRLREAIHKYYGPRSEHQFAKDIGISQGSLSDICNGNSQPSALTLLKIIRVEEIVFDPGIDILDILGGY